MIIQHITRIDYHQSWLHRPCALVPLHRCQPSRPPVTPASSALIKVKSGKPACLGEDLVGQRGCGSLNCWIFVGCWMFVVVCSSLQVFVVVCRSLPQFACGLLLFAVVCLWFVVVCRCFPLWLAVCWLWLFLRAVELLFSQAMQHVRQGLKRSFKNSHGRW